MLAAEDPQEQIDQDGQHNAHNDAGNNREKESAPTATYHHISRQFPEKGNFGLVNTMLQNMRGQ